MPAADQGASLPRYSLIPRTLIFLTRLSPVTRQEQVLLLKGAPHKRLWANRFNGIGGHVERGEDVLTAARRELLEEAGLPVSSLRLRGVITVDAGTEKGIVIFVLHGEYLAGELQPSEEGALEWVDLSQVESLPLVEDLPTLLKRLVMMQPGDPPFLAHYSYSEDGRLLIQFG